MKRRMHLGLVALLLCLAMTMSACGVARQEITIPESRGKVTDLVGLLKPQELAKLHTELERFKASTSCEFGVLVTDSLQGESVEDYTHAVFNSWGIGKKGEDNGILVVLAPNEKKWRIEPGYGLQKVITAIQADEIGTTYLVPKYRQKKYFEAITETIQQLEILASKAYKPQDGVVTTVSDSSDANGSDEMNIAQIILILFIIFIAIIVIYAVLCSRGGFGGMYYSGSSSYSSGRSNSGFWDSSGGGKSGSSDSGWGGGESGGGGASGDL